MSYTTRELLAVLTAREIKDGWSVFVGIGISQLAVELAKKMGKRKLFTIYEGGSVDPELKPPYLPYSTNDIRVGYKALMYPSCLDTFIYLQRGYVDLALMSAAQIDMYGNLNSSLIKQNGSIIKFPGSGGANDLATLAKMTIVVLPLEKRRFVKKVDFVTSPGWVEGGQSRKEQGIIGGGPYKVITDKAIFDFEPNTKMMRLEGVLTGMSLEKVLENMEFKPLVKESIIEIPPPTNEELQILRSLDPQRVFIK